MNLIQGLVAGALALVLPLLPAPAEAPFTDTAFYEVGNSGFSFRWSPGDLEDSMGCQLYEVCLYADLRGPKCQGEIGVTLEFFNKDGELVTDGGDIIRGGRLGNLDGLEFGTNRESTFSTILITDVTCIDGLPTGHAKV